jgi:hypothetical protein
MASLSEMDRLGISLMDTPVDSNSVVPISQIPPNLQKLVDELYRCLGIKPPNVLLVDNEEEFKGLVRGVGHNMNYAMNLGVVFLIFSLLLMLGAGFGYVYAMLNNGMADSKLLLFILGCVLTFRVGLKLQSDYTVRKRMNYYFKHSGPIESLTSGHDVRRKLVKMLQAGAFLSKRNLYDAYTSTVGLSLMWRHSTSSYEKYHMPFAMIQAFNKASRPYLGIPYLATISPALSTAVALNNAVDAALLGDGCVVLFVSKYAL